MNFNSCSTEKFQNVQKTVFSLSFLGLRPLELSPSLQAFIYKTYCLSTFTYGLETTTLMKTTRDYLNVSQNNIIRQMVGLNKFCRISTIRKCMKIHEFEHLYMLAKLSFIRSIFNNDICINVLLYLVNQTSLRRLNSFSNDLALLSNFFNIDVRQIIMNPIKFRSRLIEISYHSNQDGIFDSILTCLNNFKDLYYRNLLNNILYVNFYEN